MSGILETRAGASYWKPERAPFENRRHAGLLLGERLLSVYPIDVLKDAVVLGCPRGGIIYAQGIVDVIKKAGGNPTLDLVVCRKIHRPEDEDYGVGVVTEQGRSIFLNHLLERWKLDPQSEEMQQLTGKTQREVARRVEAYRQGNPLVPLAGKVVILADGVANGATMIGCIDSVRVRSEGRVGRIIVATPVASAKGKATIVELANLPPDDFCAAVEATPPQGAFWNTDDFYQQEEIRHQMTDEEVREIVRSYRPPSEEKL